MALVAQATQPLSRQSLLGIDVVTETPETPEPARKDAPREIVTRARKIRARATRVAELGEAMRGRHGSVDAVYTIVGRDGEIGGLVMAGALAYRMFIWLLPFSLVVIAGIGIAGEVGSESPEAAAKSIGLQGLVSQSVADASRGSSRWYALLIGVPVLVWATRSLLKALVIVHRLVWGDPRRVVPRPTLGRAFELLVFLVGYFAVLELARAVGAWTGIGVLTALVGLVGFSAWWLLVSLRLPHGRVPWHALLPGAAIVAVGMELISLLGAYVITPRVESSQRAYGALGVAATLLFGLYVIARLVVASAIVNATVWERRRPPADEGDSGADRRAPGRADGPAVQRPRNGGGR
jgi:uncharacterized BrkB/YihY/UPF0761 family membrane protein